MSPATALAPHTTDHIHIHLAPLPAYLRCYRYGVIELRGVIGNRWHTGTPEPLAALAEMGLRWGECRFTTDYDATYRLRAWAEGEAPILECMDYRRAVAR